ncbi:dolichol-phosphate mannosyltransferase [Clostridium acidisoli DSM 12555]|uniref:Dolichol-phosphate mannosyltransferase n=1 Tax=Clostridium acidisoli DSM 12555 TaxID=1121291 RepID=A0A1W1XUC3_9CLOT|nr:glycosyltransferase family 2 protein [Clostridium acidisoli]SMC27580.1 dolichol-phosphate mannosyltransferase [Clostridium acidisoli DSM 12555]
MENNIVYSVVVPLYNEELVIFESYKRLKEVMDKTGEKYEIVFVNDGSIDATRKKAELICNKDRGVKLINFSRNFGHQAAITAGMDVAVGDAIVVIDADLQDPPEVILEMIEKWKQGYEVVYGKRIKREGESFLKKFTAKTYYRILKSMTSVDVPVDVGDFRLIDKKVCAALASLPEKNRYVRGLVSWVGFKQTYVEFVRHERFAGETKYPLGKMIKLAMDGITSLSHRPLIFVNYIGTACSLIGLISTIVIIMRNIIYQHNILDLSLILSLNTFMFGLVFISLGIMGQYIGRIFDEAKDRPMYIIDNIISYRDVDIK